MISNNNLADNTKEICPNFFKIRNKATFEPRNLNSEIENYLHAAKNSSFIDNESNIVCEDDIIMGDSIVNFNCPLTLSRIIYPAKGLKCTHVQVFDCLAFLNFMESSKRSWKCIVCNNKISFQVCFEFFELFCCYSKYTLGFNY